MDLLKSTEANSLAYDNFKWKVNKDICAHTKPNPRQISAKNFKEILPQVIVPSLSHIQTRIAIPSKCSRSSQDIIWLKAVYTILQMKLQAEGAAAYFSCWVTSSDLIVLSVGGVTPPNQQQEASTAMETNSGGHSVSRTTSTFPKSIRNYFMIAIRRALLYLEMLPSVI